MMGATSAIIDGFWYEMLAFATAINALIYALVGTLIFIFVMGIRLLPALFGNEN